MVTASTQHRTATAHSVRVAVAGFLRIEPERIDLRTPLTAYGIDSLGALELVATLEDQFECSLPESLLTDWPDLERLTAVLAPDRARDDDVMAPLTRPTSLARMLEDSCLPNDVRPAGAAPEPATAGRVMLTGATGFLGASLLRALIDASADVVCLVRSRDGEPGDRVRTNLARYGLERPGDGARITSIAGDIEKPRLGLPPMLYEQLAADVGAVYHAAADVSWVSAYDALRSANVSATLAMLRFACAGRPKHFHFVSSLSVCFAQDGPATVTEDTDMLGQVGQLPLGYAQSKCVAESLVRAAAARGLSAQIYRPALLAGHSVSGASNVDDLIAAILKGCIQLGVAPDLDWVFDALPVDTAATAIVRLSQTASSGLETFHLRHPRPRHWRECVLWANLFGYPMRLEPYGTWLERLLREARTTDHALHRLRAFFSRRLGGLTVPELYEDRTRSRVDCTRSASRAMACGIAYPPLDADRLDSYFQDYIRRDFLPAPHTSRVRRRDVDAPAAEPRATFERLLRTFFADERLAITRSDLVRRGSEHSIISELTSWKQRQRTGLHHYRFELTTRRGRHSLDAIAKIKPLDDDVLEVGETAARICDARVHRELTCARERIGIRGGQLRELAIYEMQADRRFRRHMPVCIGTWRHDRRQSCGLLLETLDDMVVMDSAGDVDAWSDGHVATAIDGLAALHSVWLGRAQELESLDWIGHVRTSANVADMTRLWSALADHAATAFTEWAGGSLARTHANLVATAPAWWPAMEVLPRTLIHHDFNSRNVGIRRTPDGDRMVAYDWELATIGAPQRDLAEFLCFVLPPDVDRRSLDGWIERHRVRLQCESDRELPAAGWRDGFVSALNDVLVSRLAFYALIHRVRPQTFLPRVVRTWARLNALVTTPCSPICTSATR